MSRFRAKRRFGQHFLVDRGIARRIVDAAGLAGDEVVLEIGPGDGALTSLLVERTANVVAVEIDRDLCGRLRERFDRTSRFLLVEGDVLRVPLEPLLVRKGCGPAVVVGNLPYQITSPVIFRLLEHRKSVDRAVLTMQQEVARRVVALPGGREYGILSVLVRLYGEPRRLFDIGPEAFRPRPTVRSSVVRVDFMKTSRTPIEDEVRFHQVVRLAFGQRRKMLRNSLAPLLSAKGEPDPTSDVERRSGVSLTRRPETLEVEEFERLSRALAGAQGGG